MMFIYEEREIGCPSLLVSQQQRERDREERGERERVCV